jgi:hypothetical protein
MWHAYPTVRTDDLDFKGLVALLQDKHIAVLAGNPSHIEGPSALKRVGDVGHAIALLRARQRKDCLEILVDDPFRPGGKHLRGEWVPAKQVRQFAFRESDSTLTAVWAERYGAWTAESLARRQLARRVDRIEEEAATAASRLPGPSSVSAIGSRSSRQVVRSTAHLPSPRCSMPNEWPSATSWRRGEQHERPRRPPRLAPGRVAGTR